MGEGDLLEIPFSKAPVSYKVKSSIPILRYPTDNLLRTNPIDNTINASTNEGLNCNFQKNTANRYSLW